MSVLLSEVPIPTRVALPTYDIIPGSKEIMHHNRFRDINGLMFSQIAIGISNMKIQIGPPFMTFL